MKISALTIGMARRRAAGSVVNPLVDLVTGNAAVYDVSNFAISLWQDTSGTTPATVDARVDRIDDLSGNDSHLIKESTNGAYLREASGKYYLEFTGAEHYRTSNGDFNPATVCSLVGWKHDSAGSEIVWCLPQHPTSHTAPYFRIGTYVDAARAIEIRVNATVNKSSSSQMLLTPAVYILSNADAAVLVRDTTTLLSYTPEDVTYPNSVPLILGANAVGGELAEGRFYGGAWYDANLSAADTTTARTYLAGLM